MAVSAQLQVGVVSAGLVTFITRGCLRILGSGSESEREMDAPCMKNKFKSGRGAVERSIRTVELER